MIMGESEYWLALAANICEHIDFWNSEQVLVDCLDERIPVITPCERHNSMHD